jgi:hypothetical protein
VILKSPREEFLIFNTNGWHKYGFPSISGMVQTRVTLPLAKIL